MVDCGVSFAAEEHLPGIDLILPDIRYLIEERRNIVGLVLTHAHEDHMGALIDLWPRLKVPLYATPFAAALFEARRAVRARRARNSGQCRAAERSYRARTVRGRFHQRCTFDPGIERARDPHAARHGAAYRRLEDRSHPAHWRHRPMQAKLSALGDARRAGAHRRFHQCGARRPLALRSRRGEDAR